MFKLVTYVLVMLTTIVGILSSCPCKTPKTRME